ncbi:hypothetical protein B0T10DRAFT_472896 [Thelonectria olida]|uniref:NADH-ubiquinone oxidoreductase 17.8 kDa subunit n=1 Tax=Thelonectria olida TaxID=1576542 RepID=A0A9P9AY86_9HYPO|nr:hypothetical protein B0T10DRAFT_472896 [Thelonectria olida]
MFAARQRAACVARQLQRTARTYASEAHAHHKPAEVNESFGFGSKLTVATFFSGVLFYQFFVPGEGEKSAVHDLINQYTSRAQHWEEINALHTKAAQQASFDRNLFENGGSAKQRWVDVTYPEAIQSHASRNIPAGHLNNLDYAVEHFRQQHLQEEERKAAILAQKQE